MVIWLGQNLECYHLFVAKNLCELKEYFNILYLNIWITINQSSI